MILVSVKLLVSKRLPLHLPICAWRPIHDFVCAEVLRPSQQLRSCRAGQLPINTVPWQA